MKRFALITCLLVICLFSTGSYLLYRLQLQRHRETVRASLGQSAMSRCLKISIDSERLLRSDAEMAWDDNYHEVVYLGKRYDIFRIEPYGRRLTLFLIADEAEECLQRRMAGLEDQSASLPGRGLSVLLKDFLSLKCLPLASCAEIAISYHSEHLFHIGRRIRLRGVSLMPAVPPPRVKPLTAPDAKA